MDAEANVVPEVDVDAVVLKVEVDAVGSMAVCFIVSVTRLAGSR